MKYRPRIYYTETDKSLDRQAFWSPPFSDPGHFGQDRRDTSTGETTIQASTFSGRT